MSRFFFHLYGHDGLSPDLEGRELTGIDRLGPAALKEARAIIAADVPNGVVRLDARIVVTDERGTIVHRLAFADAIELVPPVETGDRRIGPPPHRRSEP